jgi:D-beta-D-heptose 7-phosphate kinase/D-beta-D-heptose 1-phosphate adenosyltransferase
VIGDFILDVYLKGTSTRLSPEAPVPVVDIVSKIEVTGGAANTAVNVSALGANVTLLSVVGMDEDGAKAIRLLQKNGVNTSRLLRYPTRNTIVKTRVMVGSHVITRYDVGSEGPIDDYLEQRVIGYLEAEWPKYDAILVSDYNKGLITEKVVQAMNDLQRNFPKYVSIDSKRLAFFKSVNASLVKPNYDEIVSLLRIERHPSNRKQQLQSLGERIFAATGAQTTAVTLDQEGAMLFEEGQWRYQACTESISSPNVVGAGDTFISAYTLSAISGATLETAANLACTASSIAVKKEGTASCSLQELNGYFSRGQKQIRSTEDLAQVCNLYRSEGKRIVFTNGCFDILHSGHVSYLNRARQLGDVLIVGVNNDESIRRLKGEKRPINPLLDRMHVLEGLTAINHLISFGDSQDDTPISLIKVVQPDIFVKGGDYTREKLPEATTVENCGGEIVFLSLVPDHSTTHIIQQIYKTSTLAVA